jgi:SAM-dependent methyltransferase
MAIPETNNKNIYDDKYSKLGSRFTERSKLVLRHVLHEYRQDIRGIKVIEIGCGSGDLLEALRDREADVFGVEISDSAVTLCKEKGIRCAKMDLSLSRIDESQVVAGEGFDLCILVEVLEHVFDYFRLTDNINRILKVNGKLFLTVPNFDSIRSLVNYLEGKSCTQIQNIGHVRFFSRDYLDKLFEIQGFTTDLRTHLLPHRREGISLSRMLQWINGPLIVGKCTKVRDARLRSIHDIFPPGQHRQIIESVWKSTRRKV